MKIRKNFPNKGDLLIINSARVKCPEGALSIAPFYTEEDGPAEAPYGGTLMFDGEFDDGIFRRRASSGWQAISDPRS